MGYFAYAQYDILFNVFLNVVKNPTEFEYNERVRKRSAAHIRKRRNLYRPALEKSSAVAENGISVFIGRDFGGKPEFTRKLV